MRRPGTCGPMPATGGWRPGRGRRGSSGPRCRNRAWCGGCRRGTSGPPAATGSWRLPMPASPCLAGGDGGGAGADPHGPRPEAGRRPLPAPPAWRAGAGAGFAGQLPDAAGASPTGRPCPLPCPPSGPVRGCRRISRWERCRSARWCRRRRRGRRNGRAASGAGRCQFPVAARLAGPLHPEAGGSALDRDAGPASCRGDAAPARDRMRRGWWLGRRARRGCRSWMPACAMWRRRAG